MSEQDTAAAAAAEAKLAAMEAKIDQLVAAAEGDAGLFDGGLFSRLTERFEAATMMGIKKQMGGGREGRAVLRFLNADKWTRQFLVSEVVANAAATADGEEVLAKDGMAFLDWLIENWPAILEMIKSIMALFGV